MTKKTTKKVVVSEGKLTALEDVNEGDLITTVAESDPVSLKTFSKYSQSVNDAFDTVTKDRTKDFFELKDSIQYVKDGAHKRINEVKDETYKLKSQISFLSYCVSAVIVLLAVMVTVVAIKFMAIKDTLAEIAVANTSQEKQIHFLLEEDDVLRSSSYYLRGEVTSMDGQIKSLIEKVYGKTK